MPELPHADGLHELQRTMPAVLERERRLQRELADAGDDRLGQPARRRELQHRPQGIVDLRRDAHAANRNRASPVVAHGRRGS